DEVDRGERSTAIPSAKTTPTTARNTRYMPINPYSRSIVQDAVNAEGWSLDWSAARSACHAGTPLIRRPPAAPREGTRDGASGSRLAVGSGSGWAWRSGLWSRLALRYLSGLAYLSR